MQKRSNGPAPDVGSRMIDRLEVAERESSDPDEKDRLAQIASSLRSAIIAGFVKRPSETNEADESDET
jgi:hypothetical protein